MRYITPEHCIKTRLGDRPPPCWAAGLMVFRDHPHSQQVLEAFAPVRPVQYPLLYNLTNPNVEPFVFEADLAGQTIVIITRCVWGGPQAAILTEELAHLGVPFILGYGVAGSIDPDLPQGRLIVAESALPLDGTSRAYGAQAVHQAEDSLIRTAIWHAGANHADLTPVTAVTVDALYRETPELMEGLRAQGGQVINLETSTLYTVAAACGVRSLWLGYVSDCLTDGRWADWFVDLRAAAHQAIRISRDLLATLLSE
ncbi:MAG: hypothetical protein JXQ73_19585 [Phycisphaerae bacterium]|nr:hypothetical protein [Phycisphaerae bacterium]